jgi:hypothetical protein
MQTHLPPSPETPPSRAPARSLQIYTDWNTPWDGSAPDAERHALFAQYAREIAMQVRPLLVSFLDTVGAEVATRPFCFSYRLADSTCWIDADEIAARLVLLPWAEAHETAH